MTRTVVTFEPLGDSTLFKLERAPIVVPGTNDHAPADVSVLAPADLVGQGAALLNRLAVHPPVKAALDAALSTPVACGPAPLYFRLGTTAAEALPWERLYAPAHGFCTLDQRWPVARIAKDWREVPERPVEDSLRVLAVLSAARRSGVAQLTALLTLVAAMPPRGALPVNLHVLTGETAVLDAVAAAGRRNVTAEWIAPTASGLGRQILAAGAHITHLLCHGGAVAGVHTLAFATLADFEADEETGSVHLKVADLVHALAPSNPWLVVLAACDTASTAGGPALAHALVAAGIPAVIGMRRLVDLSSTDMFCAQLYPEVLTTIRTATAVDGSAEARPVEWAPVLTAPRLAMGGPNPTYVDTWSDPVLYVQSDALRVRVLPRTVSPARFAELRAQLDTWQQFRATLHPETASVALIAEVEAKIAELETQLREIGGLDSDSAASADGDQ